jgi:hypothetical protein
MDDCHFGFFFKCLKKTLPLTSDLFFFNFLVSQNWLASQEGFSINWSLIFRTCLSNEKTSLRNKSESKRSEKNSNFLKYKCDDFPQKKEIRIVRQNVPFSFYFYVSYFGEILLQENVAPNMHFVLVANTCTMAIEK